MNKFRILGKVKIIENDGEKVVLKEKSKSLKELFDYLKTRDFTAFPDIIGEKAGSFIYEYLEKQPYEFNIENEMIKLIASLHYKTTYYKSVSQNKYKEIYNKLIDNVDYLKEKYTSLIESIDNERYMSPSSYLFARNYSLIMSNLYYIEKELNAWYKLVKDKAKERVCVVHNNLKKENFFKGSKLVLTGWDNYLVDTPVLDIYKLYKNEYNKLDMPSLFRTYSENYSLTNEEIKLFNILISMPLKIIENQTEYEKVKSIKESLEYTYKTSEFVKLSIFNEKKD